MSKRKIKETIRLVIVFIGPLLTLAAFLEGNWMAVLSVLGSCVLVWVLAGWIGGYSPKALPDDLPGPSEKRFKARSRKWVEISRILESEPDAKITCPECAESTIEVTDVPFPKQPQRIDRYLICPRCTASVVLSRVSGRDRAQ